ncbi:stAR-related lipid transfer protein 9 isoform X2 [Alosa sapidissima]|uniref:stAR-related lipid transfer protein 9 isoform X2 n=1 Tax=Alosa sapidissima TaxID=34773 RepID=UPI001C08183A|nr:stAR-related lipid transfer protein 9 isoform X2 [Alosa sapidissima]
MANVKVAIRVRPLNSRESVDGGPTAVQVEDKVVRIKNMKSLSLQLEGRADSRERLMEFGFDYCYWSVDPEGPNYASQEEVFQDLGVSVLSGASEGYNVCLFAYGQTGSGKTYTMIGTPDSMGLTPRICQGLFRSGEDSPDEQSSCRVEVSFLEIYNERVRDLLRGVDQKKPAGLRVREHPETGPYVQGLSQHQVTDYKQTLDLLERGIGNRITAATHVHDASSRSHAIFTIQYTQATLENNLPSEIVSKINLVDLAGSERADPHYCRDRITEGANINKSLVTLGIVISALAQNSQMFSSCQSINSVASEGEGSLSSTLSSSLSACSGRRHCYIPYRDSVLTWLLKDSLGGNSKTIMIATVSPSCSSYNETLSTLRYAAHARNIVNKPRVNEDANVRLIRELREEIDRLKSMLLNFGMRNPSPSLSDEREGSLSDIVLQNELKVDQLTKDWSESWTHKRELLEQYSVDINRDRAGFLVHSLVPHLIALDRDVLSTGVTFYHLREGLTRIGPQGNGQEEPQIVLLGGASCEIENQCGVVTLRPLPGQVCIVNGREVTEPCRLAQGAVISLGQYKFRFNHPAEAALLRERRQTSEGALHDSLSALCSLSADPSVEGAGCPGDTPPPWRRVEEQQRFVDLLREEIQVEQRKAERDLEMEQAHLRQQQSEIQQWVLKQKQRLAAIEQKVTKELGVQTDLLTPPMMDLGSLRSEDQDQEGSRPPSVVGDCKQVVQEELLRHHALRRAENRMRRKRLHYQLQRIARKRHLLEAKRELQRLVNSVPPGQDGPSSPESDSGSRRQPLLLRRHSFSADLLSRLYPQHTPIFSQFLRRNKSSEFMSLYQWSTGLGRHSSDEYFRDQPMRGRSHTLPSGYGRGSRSRASSSENLKTPLRERNTPEPGSGKSSGYKAGPSRRGSLPRSRSNSQSKSSEDTTPDTNSKATKKHVPIIGKASLQKNSTKGVKNGSHGGSKGLETIRKVFSRSVGPGIKTALARVFRKPPLGLRTGRGAKPLKAPGKLTVKPGKEKDTLDNTEKQGQGLMKATVSLDNLEQTTAATPKEDTTQRRWHSAEALSPQTMRWEGRQQDLAHWIENLQEEEGNPSDCDSLFSMDSLSSAYAAALADQLRQEELEREHSETESVGSGMSEDSLVMDSSVNHPTVRPAVRHQQVPRHLSLYSNASQAVGKERITEDGQQQRKEEEVVMEASDEMPAEVYWSLCGSPKVKARTVSVGTPGTDHERQSITGLVCGDKVVSKMSEEPSSCHVTQQSTPRSLSSSSIREPECMLALTDAWSSMDAADSPRIPRPSPGHRAPCHLLKESDRSLSPSSPDLSDHMSESECQSSFSAESTEGENTVLQAERYWESDRSAEEPASCFLRTSSEVVLSSGNTLTLASEEMVSESAELRTLTEVVVLSSGNTLTLASEEMVSASDELMNSQNDVELRHIQAELVLVEETQLMDPHVPGAIDQMIWSKKTLSMAVSVPNGVDTVDREYMSATKQSKSMDLTSNSVNAAVGHLGESVTECPVSTARANSKGSARTTLGNVAEDIKKHESKESVHIVNSMSLDSCDVEHHVHDEPQAGLTLKSTLKGIHDQCLPVNSSHYLQPTASGSLIAFDLIEQSLFDVPKAQIHLTKVDVIGSSGGGSGESTESIVAHAVEGYIETTCKEIPAYIKDFPVSIKAQQAKDVLDNFRHVTHCTAAETVQNQESEPHDITCRKSRKRIKDGQDACTSTLKFPKRCHSSPEKNIHVTPDKTDKDLKESYNNELNQSFTSKEECFVEKKPCHEEKYVFKLNTAEKNIENELKTTAHANPRSFGTNYSCIINKKISEVVQEHLEMSADSDQQHLFSVTNSGSSKSVKEIGVECTQQQHSSDTVQDYCLSSSQTVSLSPQCLTLNQNDTVTKDVPSCSHQQDFGSLQVVKDQTGCGSKEVNAHMDTKSPRSSAGRTSEESLDKGLSVLLQQDIPKELQMDSSKSKRDIMLATLKEAGKAVQSDVCNLSAKLEKGTLSAGSSVQHTDSLKVATTEKDKASVMTGQLGVSESIPPPAVEGAVGEYATFTKQHTESFKVANTVKYKASVMTGQCGVSESIPSPTADSAVRESATLSIQHTKPLKEANIEKHGGSVMTGQCGVSESIPRPAVQGPVRESGTFTKQHTESFKVANTVKDNASVMTGQFGVSESIPSPTAEGEVGESTTFVKQHTESLKVTNTVKDKAFVMTGQSGVSESIPPPAVEGEVGESTTFATQHTKSLKVTNTVKDKASVMTGQCGVTESIPPPTAEGAVGESTTFSIQHTKSLKEANIEKNDGSVMTGQSGVSESKPSPTAEGEVGESTTFAKQHTESLKVTNTVKDNASVMTGQGGVSESIPPPAVEGAVGESATFTKQHTESLKVANTGKDRASVMTGQLGVTESTTSPTVEAAVGESAASFVPPEDKICNILPVLCPREGENVHFEQTHVQIQNLSKCVASEMYPVDLNGQSTPSSHLNNLLKQTENIWIPEPPTEQSTLIFAQHMPNSQDNQSRHSHSTSYLTEHTTQNLNKNGKTFSSQMTVKAPQHRITDKHPCNESSIRNSNTLKYQEILQGHASIQQCPFDKTIASNSSDHLLDTEGNTVGEDGLIQRGEHNGSALSITSCHKPPEFNAVLQVQADQQREHFQHAELNVSHLSQTNTKQFNTQGPKYINKIELEISCNGKHSPDVSEEMLQSAHQLSSQEKPSFPLCKKTVQQSSGVTSNLKVTSVDVCGLRKAQWQLSKGTEDSDSRDDSNLSGDTSRLALTKPRDCRDNRIAANQKMKTKKFRRAQVMAPPSSSSESVPDSSSTESIPVKMRQYRSSARTRPEPQVGKQEESRHVRLDPQFSEDQKSKTRSSQSQTSLERKVNESSALQSPNSRVSLSNAKLSSATVPIQQHDDKQNFVLTQKEHRPTETLNLSEKKANFNVVSPVNGNQCKITDDTHLKHIINVSKQLSDTQLDNDMLKKEDATMQFASIDINPFIHPWQDTEPNKATYKNQVFGSAAEICSKYPLLNCPDKQMTRCCSVDNGLNVQNSPFNSHLSTYANSRGLSSTLSSMEDLKEQVSTQSHVMACRQSSLDENGQNLTTASCSSSYSGASGDLGNSSGLVDEIMLVYPSQQESQGLGNQSISMCDHSTQTITHGVDVKRRRCHHRSSTQVETTLQGKVPATWASLQNMSAHLSELIHNTSDLLGNIQGMRSGSVQRQEHIRKTRHPNQTSMKDGSTQTTLDIGIQTEEMDTHGHHTKSTRKAPVTDTNSKAHEVNVIVKVIGPNSLSVSEGDDITLSLYDRGSGRFSENVKSMPDLRENRPPSSGRLHPKGTLLKIPSLETVLPSDRHITPDVSPVFPKDLSFDKVSPSGFGLSTVRRCSSQIDVPESQTPCRRTRNYSCKQVSFTDRASSPILTVEAGVGGRDRRTSTPYHDLAERHERHNHTEKQIYTSKITSPRTEQFQTTSTKSSPGELHDQDLRKTYSSSDISIGTISTGHISDLSKSTSDVSNGSSTNSQIKNPNSRTFSHRNTSEKGTGQAPFQTPPCPQNLKWVPSPSQSTSSYQQPLHDRQQRQLFSSFDNQRGLGHQLTETPHRVPDNLRTFWNGPFELADTSQQHTLQYQDDDLMSVTPSDCNTDVLVSINPLTENLAPDKQQLIPDDLPLHNKFSNWSGLSQQRPPRLTGSPQRFDDKGTPVQNPQRNRVLSESLSSSFNPDPGAHKGDRMREIERLRKEREKVMASVHLEMNPHQLTVEMAEAKLHYGLGETDALLKVLKSGPREQSPPLTKQHLYDKHRKSIEGLKQNREARLQTCRRARSLSPSKHGSVSNRDPDSSPKISDTPTRRRGYLQQLRQEVVKTSRVPEPQRREGQCPSEIEILLRDYSRAREEARTEIARARDRLRERTEQEKRRLQQQTLSQVVQDDLRTRNRVSNSTLCTGSSLSLASSPTSGYNSSNPVIIRDMPVTAGVLEMGSKVIARPPIGGSQSMRSQRTWTSAQDIRLELQGSGSDPRPSNSPSSPPSLRPRALSFGSPSSLATAYQDIASHALTHALAEVRLASAGELRNLLAGKSAAGWRHQGSERGVQVFHKPGPRATVHGFLGAMELQKPVESLWSVIRDHSKAHLYNSSVSSSWTRALDEHTQLVYMLSHPSSFNLKQPRDFCCISIEAKQDERWVMAMQSVYEESLPRPSVDAVRAEVLPSAWILQPSRKQGQEQVTVIYMLQVDLGPPAIPHRLLGAIARKQASVIAELDAFFSL